MSGPIRVGKLVPGDVVKIPGQSKPATVISVFMESDGYYTLTAKVGGKKYVNDILQGGDTFEVVG